MYTILGELICALTLADHISPVFKDRDTGHNLNNTAPDWSENSQSWFTNILLKKIIEMQQIQVHIPIWWHDTHHSIWIHFPTMTLNMEPKPLSVMKFDLHQNLRVTTRYENKHWTGWHKMWAYPFLIYGKHPNQPIRKPFNVIYICLITMPNSKGKQFRTASLGILQLYRV